MSGVIDSFILSSCTDTHFSKMAVGILTTGLALYSAIQSTYIQIFCPLLAAHCPIGFSRIISGWHLYQMVLTYQCFRDHFCQIIRTLMIETESVSETLNVLEQPDMAFSLRRCYWILTSWKLQDIHPIEIFDRSGQWFDQKQWREPELLPQYQTINLLLTLVTCPAPRMSIQ